MDTAVLASGRSAYVTHGETVLFVVARRGAPVPFIFTYRFKARRSCVHTTAESSSTHTVAYCCLCTCELLIEAAVEPSRPVSVSSVSYSITYTSVAVQGPAGGACVPWRRGRVGALGRAESVKCRFRTVGRAGPSARRLVADARDLLVGAKCVAVHWFRVCRM